MSIFIDNIKIMGIKMMDVIDKIKIKLIASFSIVNIEFISFYLKPKVDRD